MAKATSSKRGSTEATSKKDSSHQKANGKSKRIPNNFDAQSAASARSRKSACKPAPVKDSKIEKAGAKAKNTKDRTTTR